MYSHQPISKKNLARADQKKEGGNQHKEKSSLGNFVNFFSSMLVSTSFASPPTPPHDHSSELTPENDGCLVESDPSTPPPRRQFESLIRQAKDDLRKNPGVH